MPRATIWIRDENWHTWESIKNKSDEVNKWLITRKNPATTDADSASRTKPKATPSKPSSPNIGPYPHMPKGVNVQPATVICQHGWPLQTCPDARCNKKARDRGII